MAGNGPSPGGRYNKPFKAVPGSGTSSFPCAFALLTCSGDGGDVALLKLTRSAACRYSGVVQESKTTMNAAKFVRRTHFLTIPNADRQLIVELLTVSPARMQDGSFMP